MLQPGQRIGGKYQLVRQLGQGGMGVVWEATNLAIDRGVAIKLMLPELTRDEQALQRFFNEARICGRIRHAGIVDVLDLGRAEDGSPFLVMELLDGMEVDTLMSTNGQLSAGLVLPIVRDAARTVGLAHGHGVVHRDLKPSNLFLHRGSGGRPVVKVLDFGISKIIAGAHASKVTRTGTVLGTPAYMSPEQAGGRLALDHRADIYSLGVILFEGLAGRLPFEGPTPNAFLIDIATKDAPPVTDFRTDVHPTIAALIAACLQRDRDRRIATAADLAARLDAALRATGTPDELPQLDLSCRGQLPSKRHEPPSSISTFESQRRHELAVEATLSMGSARSGNASATTASPLSSERPAARTRGARSLWLLAAAGALAAIGGVAVIRMADSPSGEREGAAASAASNEVSPPAGGAAVERSTAHVSEPPAAAPVASEPPAASASATTSANTASSRPAPRAKPSPVRSAEPKKGPPPAAKSTDVWGYD